MIRSDQHRPGNLTFNPAEYVLEGVGITGHIPVTNILGQTVYRGWQPSPTVVWDGVYSGKNIEGRCDHCGAHLKYWAALKHTPTDCYIRVGEQCLDNRFDLSAEKFHSLRLACQLDRERAKAIEQYSAAEPAIFQALWPLPPVPFDGPLASLRESLHKYGSLTERQTAYARKLLAASAARKRPSQHLGTVGEDVTLLVTLSGTREGVSATGRKWTMTMAQANGADDITWFGDPLLEPGKPTIITGQVREHRLYQGDAVTTLASVIRGDKRVSKIKNVPAKTTPFPGTYGVRVAVSGTVVSVKEGASGYGKWCLVKIATDTGEVASGFLKVKKPTFKVPVVGEPGTIVGTWEGVKYGAASLGKPGAVVTPVAIPNGPVSQADAIKYGRAVAVCAICGADLDNDESVKRGIGPVCAKKYL